MHQNRFIRRSMCAAVGTVMLFGAFVPRAWANPPRNGLGFGIADDDDPALLTGRGFRQLETKIFRFTVPYDAASIPGEMERARQKVRQARATGVQSIMVTFRQKAGQWTSPYDRPDPADWGRMVQMVVADPEFNAAVDLWGVANEPNAGVGWLSGAHSDGPKKLAGYYHQLRNLVQPPDKLVSPEWHDEDGSDGQPKKVPPSEHAQDNRSRVAHYIAHYVAAGGGFGNFVGWHPYGGVQRRSDAGTRDLLRNTPSSVPVLITEVGAIVHHPTRPDLRLSLAAQRQRVLWLVRDLANVSPRIQRVYYYHLRQPSDPTKWDSALDRKNGKPRPAWRVYCTHATHAGRAEKCRR